MYSIYTIQSIDLARSILVFLHIILFVVAAVAVAFGDYSLFGRRTIDGDLLFRMARIVKWSLLALLISGVGVLTLDDWAGRIALANNAKLRAKFTVFFVLVLNGWLLHKFSLNFLAGRSRCSRVAAKIAATLGAVSAVSWIFAAFLGVAKAWSPVLGYAGFMWLYLTFMLIGIVIAQVFVAPELFLRVSLTKSLENLKTLSLRRGSTISMERL